MTGPTRKSRGKGFSFFTGRIQTYQQRRLLLMEDSAVEEIAFMVYQTARNDLLTGVSPCNTGFEVIQRVKELI